MRTSHSWHNPTGTVRHQTSDTLLELCCSHSIACMILLRKSRHMSHHPHITEGSYSNRMPCRLSRKQYLRIRSWDTWFGSRDEIFGEDLQNNHESCLWSEKFFGTVVVQPKDTRSWVIECIASTKQETKSGDQVSSPVWLEDRVMGSRVSDGQLVLTRDATLFNAINFHRKKESYRR